VITYLKDHPHDYRKAANLIQDKLLSSFLAAYQAWVWNLIVARYLDHADLPTVGSPHSGTDPAGAQHALIRIARTAFPLPKPDPAVTALCEVAIDLPRLTAHYPGVFEAAAAAAFESEGLTTRDFKARILRRVYLPKRERVLAFVPQEVACGSPEADERAPGRYRTTVSFTLPPGQYASLVLKAAAALIGVELRVRP
jgi:tRNA pseudouridine13 synthase